YIVREMQAPEGGYYSATDADSEGEEGKFFVFLPEEIDDILGKDDAEAFCLYYDISVGGNFEGKNILNTPRSVAEVARELGVDAGGLARELEIARQKVYAAREQRPKPLLDDKILTSWNGLMIEAMAEGYRVLRNPLYLESATRAADFVLRQLARPDGGLFRTTRAGRTHVEAFLEDYAYFGDALVSLYEASGQFRFLEHSRRLAERVMRDFSAEDGAFYQTAAQHEALITRARSGHDGALPNANAVTARWLARVGYHYDSQDLVERARRALLGYGQLVERAPRMFATALCVTQWLLDGPTELVLVGDPGQPNTERFLEELSRRYLPNRVVAMFPDRSPPPTRLARDKSALHGRPTLYVCRNFACLSPLTEPSHVAAALQQDRERPQAPDRLELAPVRA
ncbi:MAG TPA: hypothetical protein VFQ61_07270, partial [Polyangiaceae bacterium]|nr:hypothetical protein [Polyangiaceae bacterium]